MEEGRRELTLSIPTAILAFSGLERDVLPEIAWELALLGRVPTGGGTVCFHSSGVFAVADVGVWITGHDHAMIEEKRFESV